VGDLATPPERRVGYRSVALPSLTVRPCGLHLGPQMNATARRSYASTSRQTRPEREPSDMANEMLARVIKGLATCCTLSARDQHLLYHYLFGRTAEATGQRLAIRDTTVHKHLHRIFTKTRTDSRRDLLELGLRLAKQHGITDKRIHLALAA
jgi:DNA-binding CsgD family transcriptional regulator